MHLRGVTFILSMTALLCRFIGKYKLTAEIQVTWIILRGFELTFTIGCDDNIIVINHNHWILNNTFMNYVIFRQQILISVAMEDFHVVGIVEFMT